jgi:hypothetical protein
LDFLSANLDFLAPGVDFLALKFGFPFARFGNPTQRLNLGEGRHADGRRLGGRISSSHGSHKSEFIREYCLLPNKP